VMKNKSGKPPVDVGIGELMGSEEALAQAIHQLTSKKPAKFLSDLTQDEINQLAVGFTIGEYIEDKTGSGLLTSMFENFLQMRVSLNRKGRGEIVGIITWMNMMAGGMQGSGGSSGGGKLAKIFKR